MASARVFQDDDVRSAVPAQDQDGRQRDTNQQEDQDLSDLLQELRILLQGVQVLTAFLIILPFSEGFGRLDQIEKWVYLATFVSSLTGLIFISAPAAQHRLQRPLRNENRVRFKHFATQMIVVGLAAFSVALVMASQLVSNEVVGFQPSLVVAGFVATLLGVVWWLIPVTAKVRRLTHLDDEQTDVRTPAAAR